MTKLIPSFDCKQEVYLCGLILPFLRELGLESELNGSFFDGRASWILASASSLISVAIAYVSCGVDISGTPLVWT